MSEPRLVSPMLDGFALGGAISNHSGVRCYPAMRSDSDERYIVKTISIPASQVQLDALLLSGAYPNAEAARNYFKTLANGIRSEIQVLDQLAAQRGFLPYLNHQIVPMADAIGYEIYLLSPYKLTLDRHLRHEPLTHLSAVNMGIDLCAALAICRENGYLYVDLKPENIVLSGDQTYHIADLGFVALNALKFASLPERYRSAYTAPEISDAYAMLNTTMDTYALGMVLYQVFNDGKLPDLSQGAPEGPCYADPEMTEIVLRAISADPAERYADPMEMGKALISYMQRNTVNDVPIGPAPVEETPEEELPAEDPAEEMEEPGQTVSEESEEAAEPAAETGEPEEAGEAEEASEEPQETEETEDADEEPEAAEEESDGEEESGEAPVISEEAEDAAEDEAAPEEDWIDLMDSILAESLSGEEAARTDEPSLRELLAQREDDEPAEGDSPLTDEAADLFSQAQELVEHEAPEPVIAPEPIEIPMPEPIVPEEEADEADATDEAFEKIRFSDEEDDEDEDSDEETPAEEQSPEEIPAKPRGKFLRRLGKLLVVLLILAGLAAGGYYYYEEIYLQPIRSCSVTGEADTMIVTVDTDADPSLLTVICKDTYGNATTAPLVDGKATFSQLKPASQYTVTVEISGFHQLTGTTTGTYSTPERTQVLNLSAVTGSEDGSVILNFAVEGPDSEEWTLSYQSGEEEPQVVTFSGHTVTINGLVIGQSYTFTLTGDDDIYLIGDSSIVYDVRDVILAQNLTVSSYLDTSLTVSWEAPEGLTVPSWTARCYNEEGYDQVVQVETSSVTFQDINPDSGYTLEITAQGMTQSTRLFVTANPINILSVVSNVTADSIDLSWDYDGKTPDSGWLILYTVDGGSEQIAVKAEEPKASISPIAPGSHYDFVIQTADSTSVFGGSGKADVPGTDAVFSAHGLSANNIDVSLFYAPEKDGWTRKDLTTADKTSTFKPGSDMALVFFTGSIYQLSDESFTTLMVIRDSEGRLAAIDSSTRTWDDMWDSGYCEVECNKLPAAPGSYTLDVFLNGAKLTTKTITIAE